MYKKIIMGVLCCFLFFSLGGCSQAATPPSNNPGETLITLSDDNITVNGSTASSNSEDAVYVGAGIVYYEAGKDESYGEGTQDDEHTAEEAANNTVVTITQAGTYRINGKLSQGQLAVDLGESASENPEAVVTLILDGADITCTVAPAVIFYNVWESGNTEFSGANVILADNSENIINGSYVARIYKEGTTSKLHKYDGAFYSKMSMLVSAEETGNGVLNITAENEGLDSELHLTINGGKIYIEAQNDGINTNEDGVSVTTINNGYLFVNAGLGAEGDGIDSNGSLVINGGTIISFANGRSGDGGLDADGDIVLNGGTVIALGSRNDAASTSSTQPYMELSYASMKSAGEIIRIEDASGNELLTVSPLKEYQSLTFTSPDLELDKAYYVYAGGEVAGVGETNGLYETGGTYTGGTQQQYTGNSFGMMGGGPFGGNPQTKGDTEGQPQGERPADGETPPQMNSTDNNNPPSQMGDNPEMSGENPPGGGQNNGIPATAASSGDGSVEFIITGTAKSFSGVSDAIKTSDKTEVIFSINSNNIMENIESESTVILNSITAISTSGEAIQIPESDIQITITDIPSENYSQACLLSDGQTVIEEMLPTDDGTYQLTISVISSNSDYIGTNQWQFTIGQ